MKKNKRPSVDVILCCYNQEEYIAQAVQSILAQRVEADVRVIVADDCSTDDTMPIIRRCQSQSPFPFLYLDSDHNMGMKANYQRSFAACSADYTAILEGDDWWDSENHLAQHLNFLQSHPRHSMSYNLIAFHFQDTGRTRRQRWLYKDIDYLSINLREQISWGNQIGNLSSCVFRTSLLHSLPDTFFQLNFADWELGIMMALKGPIAMLREVTSTYRINSKGQWSALSHKEKFNSQANSLRQLQPLLPFYCRYYIKAYEKRLLSGKAMPYKIPLKNQIKSTLKKTLALTCGNRSKNQRTHT